MTARSASVENTAAVLGPTSRPTGLHVCASVRTREGTVQAIVSLYAAHGCEDVYGAQIHRSALPIRIAPASPLLSMQEGLPGNTGLDF